MAKRRTKYGNLIKELAITDFKLKYQGSVLGYLWSFAKPLMLFGVLYLVFTKFIPLGKGVPHYPIYLLLGIVLWTYFADSTMTAMASIVDRQDLIRKVYFPRIVIVIAASISSLITLALNLLVIFVFMAFAHIVPHLNALLFIPLIIELYMLSLGCALLLSSLYVKFRDFRHIWEVVLQILFYASAIIYPLNILPHKYWTLILINPVAQIMQDARWLLITSSSITSHQVLSWKLLLIPYLLPLLAMVIGWAYFNSAAAKFAEEV